MPVVPVDCNFNPLPSCEGRLIQSRLRLCKFVFQSTPLMRGETMEQKRHMRSSWISIHSPHARGDCWCHNDYISDTISIHSPHARGDSINFQRIHRIQGSLYNTIHFTRFCEFFQSVLGRKNAVYAVRSSPENHDSFTFAQPLRIRRYSLIWQATPCGICSVSTLT